MCKQVCEVSFLLRATVSSGALSITFLYIYTKTHDNHHDKIPIHIVYILLHD